jgi:CRISPR-associated protein Csd1
MLHQLANYAAKYNVTALPGFKPKTAKWVIVLTEEGKFIDLVEDNREFSLAPDLDQGELIAGGIARSHFLIDTAGVALAYESNEREKKKHDFFIELLQEAGGTEPRIGIIARTLQNGKNLDEIQAKFQAKKGKKNDTVTFRVGDTYPVALTSWHGWWNEFRQSIKPADEADIKMICLLSGEKTAPLATHSKIGGLTRVGGQPSGSTLIGFDKDSFTSFGLKQSQNAACSETAIAVYRNAMQHLIDKAPAPLAGTMFLSWYKEPVSKEDDLFGLEDFDNPAAEEAGALAKVEELLNSVREGKRPDLLNNRYYILQISGAGGRIMVRDWLEGDYVELASNLKQWFNDLTLISPNGKGRTKDFKLSASLTRLVSYRKNDSKIFKRISDELPPLMPRLWRSIIYKLPLPDTVAYKSLDYIRSRLYNNDDDTLDNLDRIACALLKAWLVRKNTDGGGKQMKPDLNPNHPSPAYHAGRLMAVLAALQNRALGNVGAGVVQRYYAAASTTPALVLGRLVRGAQYHLNKLDKGLANWYEGLIGQIMVKSADSFPATLTLEEQSIFALGYYQQRAAIYAGTGKKGDKEAETENKNEEGK